MRWVALVAAIAALVAAACSSSSAKTYSGLYISLGDSIAAGNGASDAATTSFVALLAKEEGGLQVDNLAVAGATTGDVIDTQLPQVVDAARGKKLAFITISAGGNDLAALVPNTSCQVDPLPASCPLDDALAKVETNLNTIMKRLREIEGGTPIVLLLYPNFFSGTGHPFEAPASRVLPRLDEVIARVAAKYQHTGVALGAPAFEGRGGQLTHTLDPVFDPHPNDAGPSGARGRVRGGAAAGEVASRCNIGLDLARDGLRQFRVVHNVVRLRRTDSRGRLSPALRASIRRLRVVRLRRTDSRGRLSPALRVSMAKRISG